MMHPRAWNLHDWAEVYFEGVGWVPVDQSFGIPAFARNADEEYFFLGGIDSWRMIVNTDYGMPLVPEKKYPRSETVDFQRGEVEWEGGNLYFPQWSYTLVRLLPQFGTARTTLGYSSYHASVRLLPPVGMLRTNRGILSVSLCIFFFPADLLLLFAIFV